MTTFYRDTTDATRFIQIVDAPKNASKSRKNGKFISRAEIEAANHQLTVKVYFRDATGRMNYSGMSTVPASLVGQDPIHSRIGFTPASL